MRPVPLLILLLLPLGACATATPIYGPDGEPAVLVDCSGAAVPLSACFNKAAEACPAGYALLDTQEGAAVASYTAFGGSAMTGATKRIVVRCKGEAE